MTRKTVGDEERSGSLNVEANTTSPALRITQTGSGPALLVEDSASPDSSPFVVDASGNVGVGTSSPDRSITVYGASNSRMRLDGDATTDVVIRRASTNGSSPQFYMDKARGTIAAPSSVAAGDVTGQIYFRGHDGTSYLTSALVSAEVDGTPGTNDMPGRLVFATTADGASSPTERMRIDSAGNVGIGGPSSGTLLDVVGGASDVLSRIRNAAGIVDLTMQSGGNFRITHNTAGKNINMVTGGAERFILDSAGLITGTGTSLGGWTAYTPTLGGTGWAIGNGTAEGEYVQIGKIVHARGTINFNSTSTFGAGNITISLPISRANRGATPQVTLLFNDVSVSKGYLGTGYIVGNGTTATLSYLINGTNGEVGAVVSSTPFTWASLDQIFFSFTYQAA